MQSQKHKYRRYWIWSGYLLVTLLILLNSGNFLYWDTVQLAGKHGNFFYNTGFSSLLLPNKIDSGHIPAFGMYIAFLWKLFGKTLLVSHLAILPFALGIVFQLKKLVAYFVNPNYLGAAVILLIIDPTLLSQIVLVSPDVPLVFFFLLATNAILNDRKVLLGIAVFMLFLISMRGMMLSLCLLLLDLYCNVSFSRKVKHVLPELMRRSLIYLPALAIFLTFSLYHYVEKGWIGFHSESPWAGSFERVDLKGFFYNIGILGWRILDFGRIGVWLVMAIVLSLAGKMVLKGKKTRMLLFFLITLLLMLPLNMLWAKGLLGHRYLLPIFLIAALLAVRLVFSKWVLEKNREPLAYLMFFILVSGNFWIYPPRIAQGWDATLAHLPYYELRMQGMNYLDKQQIDFTEVGSFFPNTADVSDIDLSEKQGHFLQFDGTQQYVFYSNSYNISDTEYEWLQASYSEIHKLERRGVYVIIYERK